MLKPYYDQDGITIYHGDCLEILPAIQVAGGVDLVLTDPPFALSVVGSVHRGKAGKGIRTFDFFDGDDDHWAMVNSVMMGMRAACCLLADHGSAYAYCGHREISGLAALFEREFQMKTRMLAWEKKCPAPPPPGSGWPSAFELCIYGYRAGRRWNYDAQSVPRTNIILADSFRHGQPGKVDHPTQKPLAVIEPLLVASAKIGDMVLDPYLGSGTTAVACKMGNMKCIGIEREEAYCEVAVGRLAQSMLPLARESDYVTSRDL